MAPGLQMPAPVCLIENEEGQLKVNQEALEILDSIKEPVIVVAIVGLQSTVKSYLMNNLAGFSPSSTVKRHTKGLWMWCVPHPYKSDHTLVLLNIAGLDDVDMGNNNNDTWIFSLAVLLSSTFVYKSKSAIDQPAIDQLNYVSELTDHIKRIYGSTISETEEPSELVAFFPDLIWITYNNFTSQLEASGKHNTSDQYLATALSCKPGAVGKNLLPHQSIKQFFPKRICFIFNMPIYRKKFYQNESLHDYELDPEFVEQAQNFCSYVFQNSSVKTVLGGITVTGSLLKNLVPIYVEAITRREIPYRKNAVLTLAQMQNFAAVQRAIARYEESMQQKVHFPTETLKQFLDVHAICEREAIAVFLNKCSKDMDQKSQEELMSLLEIKMNAFCKENTDTSKQVCNTLINDIFSPLEKELEEGAFLKRGGYQLFQEKTKELIEKYILQPQKGIQSEETLQEYLNWKEEVANAILKADKKIPENEKETEVNLRKAQRAEADAKKLEEMKRKKQALIKQAKKSYQEFIKQVIAKMNTEKKQLIVEQGLLHHQLEEQERLLKERFHNEAQQLRQQINSLKKQMINSWGWCSIS